MTGGTRAAVLLAAAAVLAGLAWWLLGSGPSGVRAPEPAPPRPAVTPRPSPGPGPPIPIEPGGPGAAEAEAAAREGRTLSVTGRVLDPSGKPVEGAKVGAVARGDLRETLDLRRVAEALFEEPAWLSRTTSRADGTFTLSALGPGRRTLVAEAPGFAPARAEDVLLHAPGGAPPVDLVLGAARGLLVRVEDAVTGPLAGADVVAASRARSGMPLTDGVSSRALTDAAGEARFAALPAGRTILVVRAHGDRVVFRTVPIPEVETLTIRIEGSASLRLRVRDASGAPVEGAAATALLESVEREDEGGERLAGTTGPDGTVLWEGLPASRLLLLAAEKTGFATASVGIGREPQGDPADELREGAVLEKELVLTPGAVVAGVVKRLPGVEPVPGARVTLRATGLLLLGPERTTVSDAAGAYRFDGVAAGPATLLAFGKGVASASSGERPSPAPAEDPGLVQVPPGPAEVRLDLFVEETGRVSGRVFGPSGDPQPGARVGLTYGNLKLEVTVPERLLPGPVYADAKGWFEIPEVPAGEAYLVAAFAADLLPGLSAPFALPAGGEVAGLDLRLAAGGTLVGRVAGPSGEPVAGARVRASVRTAGRSSSIAVAGSGGGAPEAVTDAGGDFRIHPIAPGSATVSVEAEECVAASRSDVTVAAGVETRADFLLEAGLAVAGVVRDAEGRPVDGARVWVRAPRGGMFSGGTRGRSRITDGGGRFRVGGLSAGRYEVAVVSSRYAEARLADVPAGSEALEIRLDRGLRISGRVTDAGGSPLGGIRVVARAETPGGAGASARTAADGTFVLDRLAAGTYRVTAQPPGGKYADATVEGVAGGAEGIQFRLEPSFEIRGRVVRADGSPSTERVRIRAMAAPDTQIASTRADGKGEFVLTGLPEGSYTIRAFLPERPELEGTTTAAAGSAGVLIRLGTK